MKEIVTVGTEKKTHTKDYIHNQDLLYLTTKQNDSSLHPHPRQGSVVLGSIVFFFFLHSNKRKKNEALE